VLLGRLMAGRMLRPLGDMTATVRRITADRLDRRLAASGPDDELKELADTFDELLDRRARSNRRPDVLKGNRPATVFVLGRR
jgi:nitrate/nitrite-specific signal transduction histidine kinase